ncbi:MAG: late competence development ComFB family protein [Eubacteriales bacterium]
MELHNYTEKVVREVLDDILAKREGICKCEKCRLDMMAIALNNLQPQYYVSNKGEVFSKLQATYMEMRTKVLTEVTKATMLVERQPQHP